jgi:hypothetical protein
MAAILLRPHGEHGNAMSELKIFHPRWWRERFRKDGFDVIEDEPVGLFYTGEMLRGPRLAIPTRERLAQMLGSATHMFALRMTLGGERRSKQPSALFNGAEMRRTNPRIGARTVTKFLRIIMRSVRQ